MGYIEQYKKFLFLTVSSDTLPEVLSSHLGLHTAYSTSEPPVNSQREEFELKHWARKRDVRTPLLSLSVFSGSCLFTGKTIRLKSPISRQEFCGIRKTADVA